LRHTIPLPDVGINRTENSKLICDGISGSKKNIDFLARGSVGAEVSEGKTAVSWPWGKREVPIPHLADSGEQRNAQAIHSIGCLSERRIGREDRCVSLWGLRTNHEVQGEGSGKK
jgi:hypothetical protein